MSKFSFFDFHKCNFSLATSINPLKQSRKACNFNKWLWLLDFFVSKSPNFFSISVTSLSMLVACFIYSFVIFV